MRISSIGIGNCCFSNKSVSHKKLNTVNNTQKLNNEVSFKGGLEVGAKSVAGTILGIGLGVLTGGVGAPLILGMLGAAAGKIKGTVDEASKGNSSDDDGYYGSEYSDFSY